VFDQLHLEVLDRLGLAGRLDWSRASVDSASVRAKRGDHVGANPVDRGKPGSKLHLVSEGRGLPLTAANVNDTLLFAALLEDVPAVRTRPGGGRAGLARSTPTRPTTMLPTGPGCGVGGSRRGSPGVGSSRRAGWDAIAGGLSGRCRGCRATGGLGCGGIVTRNAGSRLCWPARWSATTGSNHLKGAKQLLSGPVRSADRTVAAGRRDGRNILA
jgi:hypothetical protein